jgi:hypothetical protein
MTFEVRSAGTTIFTAWSSRQTRGVTLPRNRRFSFLAASAALALSMPLGLILGRALQTFQTGDLFALLADNLLQGGNFAKQLNQQGFRLWTA